MSQIFISYSRKDEEFARKLARSLSEEGAEIWMDVEDIPPGMKWSTAIQQGLNTCDVMLLILSPDSMASKNVEDEWQYFMDEQKLLLPILLRPTSIHFQLRRIQYMDFSNESYEITLKRLIAQLQAKGLSLAQKIELKPDQSTNERQIIVEIEGNRYRCNTVAQLYQSALQFLVDNKYIKGLPVPFKTSEQRYLLASEPTHPDGRAFYRVVSYKKYHLEANKSRESAIKDLQKLFNEVNVKIDVIQDWQ